MYRAFRVDDVELLVIANLYEIYIDYHLTSINILDPSICFHNYFARKGVPAIFYFSGVHEDYHKSTDTVEKIDFELLHQRALLTFHTAWLLANREERIVVDGKVE